MKRALLLLLVAHTAAADPEAPLAQIHDDKTLAETLAQITSDPTIHTVDPKARAAAQALMSEGVKQVRAASYEQGLANFLDAYGKFPSPRILIAILENYQTADGKIAVPEVLQKYVGKKVIG